jgi:Protein of unknown function (DUF3011)
MNRWKLSLLALSFVLLSCAGLHAQSGITAQNGRSVTCASDDGKRHLCAVNTQYGVRMTNQRSGSPCIQGQTWGYNTQGIWVDRGCRADFWLGGGWNGGRPGNGYPGGGGTITCSSDNGKRNYCNANTRNGVRMVNQRSGSPCIQDQTWGYNQNSIWVDRGCRADFALGGGWNGGGPGYPGGGGRPITCSSDNGKRNYCNIDTRGGVRMVNQRSGSPCIQGQTWGYNQTAVWVDRGCRADFMVGGH